MRDLRARHSQNGPLRGRFGLHSRAQPSFGRPYAIGRRRDYDEGRGGSLGDRGMPSPRPRDPRGARSPHVNVRARDYLMKMLSEDPTLARGRDMSATPEGYETATL